MENELATADKEVIVAIVKLAQKQGLKGASGDWKEFLGRHDRKFGASLSDPAKRSTNILSAFLKTFTQDEDLKFFANIMRRHRNCKSMERIVGDLPDCESPQQKLVLLTIEHPRYFQDYSFPSHRKDWMVAPLGKVSKATKSNAMIAVDCEMVLCEDGMEAVVRICAVDHNLEVILNELVNPNKAVADYRTHITGILSKDLEGVTCSLVDIQKSLKKLLSLGTILVGHSLYNDLQALKIDHARVIDTSYIFKYMDMPTLMSPSLNNLCKAVLGTEVRKEGDPHNCLHDAQATMKLVLAKLEHGFEDPIVVLGKDVPETDLGKLLLHRIPVDVPSQELLKLFSGDSSVHIQPDLRVRGQSYSTFAVFKDFREAHEAFGEIEGQEDKDSSGRPQKLVTLKLGTGKTTNFYIRKMVPDVPPNDCESKKRKAQNQSVGLEVQRTILHQCDHVEEIERLKCQLRQREDEIFNLQKILSTFTS